jgi:hypothetical protein
MKCFNVKKEYASLERFHSKDEKTSIVKNDCYVTRYIYTVNSNGLEMFPIKRLEKGGIDYTRSKE